MEDALAGAWENNPQVEFARAVANASEELVTQAEAAYGPTLNLNARHGFTYTSTEAGSASRIESDGFASSVNVSLNQPLFTSGLLSANLDSVSAQSMAARQDLRGAGQQLILDVVTAYVSVRRDLELYSVASETYSLLLQQRDLTRSRLNLRDATAPDVDQTESRVEIAAGQLIQARATLEASAANYRNLVGSYPSDLAPPPRLPALPSLEELYESGEMYNPQLQAQKLLELATRSRIASARAARGPQIAAEVVAGRSPLQPYENSTYIEQVSAGVTLNMPLYASGRLSSQVREGVARNQAAQQTVEQARRDMRNSLATNWNQWQAAAIALPRFIAAAEAAERAVEGVQRQETAGIRTLRDVLDVTNDLFVARSNAAVAEAELYFRQAAVLRDAGLLTIDLFVPMANEQLDTYDPSGAGIAGMPFGPLIEPLDRVLLRDAVRDAGVEIENDLEYEDGENLPSPLEPLSN